MMPHYYSTKSDKSQYGNSCFCIEKCAASCVSYTKKQRILSLFVVGSIFYYIGDIAFQYAAERIQGICADIFVLSQPVELTRAYPVFMDEPVLRYSLFAHCLP